MRSAIVIGIAVLLGLEGTALAQSSKEKIESIEFPDDKLLNTPLFPDSAKIGGNHVPVRTLLVRPRTHFVPELVETIENI